MKIRILTLTLGALALSLPAIAASAEGACDRYDQGYSQGYGYEYEDGGYDPNRYGAYGYTYNRPAYGRSGRATNAHRDQRGYRDRGYRYQRDQHVSGGYSRGHRQGGDRHYRQRRRAHGGNHRDR